MQAAAGGSHIQALVVHFSVFLTLLCHSVLLRKLRCDRW
jgi:hypothetical protein